MPAEPDRRLTKARAMDRNQDHIEGYRRAAKDAVEFLENRAREFNDPHAKQVLHSAAFNLGAHLSFVSKNDDYWNGARRAALARSEEK